MLKSLLLALAVAFIPACAMPQGAFARTPVPAKAAHAKKTATHATPTKAHTTRKTSAHALSARKTSPRPTAARIAAARTIPARTLAEPPPDAVPCQPSTARQPITCEPATVRPLDRYFVTSDNVRLHYIEAGPLNRPTIVFVPGWTMPAWIFTPQITALSHDYHVIAFDPRGQGASDTPETGYEPTRRGRDIRDLIEHLNTSRLYSGRVAIVAWSLGVLDTLAMIHTTGDAGVAALILVDNSVGEEPAPTPSPRPVRPQPRVSHETGMERFVSSMFRRRQSTGYLERLTEASLRTPEYAAHLLLSYPVPRTYWRQAVYATQVPVLYVIRPLWLAQGENLLHNRPHTELDVFSDTGHALFVDDSPRFNADLVRFLRQKVWP